jgi:hypothetical protein
MKVGDLVRVSDEVETWDGIVSESNTHEVDIYFFDGDRCTYSLEDLGFFTIEVLSESR